MSQRGKGATGSGDAGDTALVGLVLAGLGGFAFLAEGGPPKLNDSNVTPCASCVSGSRARNCVPSPNSLGAAGLSICKGCGLRTTAAIAPPTAGLTGVAGRTAEPAAGAVRAGPAGVFVGCACPRGSPSVPSNNGRIHRLIRRSFMLSQFRLRPASVNLRPGRPVTFSDGYPGQQFRQAQRAEPSPLNGAADRDDAPCGGSGCIRAAATRSRWAIQCR